MSEHDANAETTEPPEPGCRDEALRAATHALADASKQLMTAASHAGNLDGTRADLELFSEEARDVYTRVAALSLRFSAMPQQTDPSGTPGSQPR